MQRMNMAFPGLLALLLLFAGTAFAQVHGMERPGMQTQNQGGQQYDGPGGTGSDWSAEKANSLYQLQEKYREQIMPLQRRLWAKDAELASLLHQDNPDEKRIDSLIEEMGKLRTEIFRKNLAYRREVQKEVGDFVLGPMPRCGTGQGMRGSGMMGHQGMNQEGAVGPGYSMGSGAMIPGMRQGYDMGPGMMDGAWGSCPYTE